jgi:hypothetical protein
MPHSGKVGDKKMTIERRDGNDTEFGAWLRLREELSSKRSKGYITSNIDYVWMNYNTGDWMLIEEKRQMAKLTNPSQETIFSMLNSKIKSLNDKKYRGFHVLQFKVSDPENGRMYLNGNEISKEVLIEWLAFRIYKKGYYEQNEENPTINEFFS